MSRLRPFQARVKAGVYVQWQAGHKNVLGVIPTGGGKSVVNGEVFREYTAGASCAIAHRGELVGQLALALAREGVRHRIIGPTSLMRTCTAVQMAELGRSMTDPGARVAVAGVDTLVKRDTSHDSWFRAVGLWAVDEAHHVQLDNKWGTAVGMFPNAFGLGWTATPGRADGGGLGRSPLGNGVFDEMVVGPTPRELINAGYLTDYRIFAPPSDVVYDDVPISAGGDYSPAKLRAAVHASAAIVGDVVKHYLRIAPGKRGITFAVDVESAQEIARAFRAAGVAAEVVSAKTDDITRARILRQFREGTVLQLVNVDLFGEGFDVPACEVVSMVRKTESFSLYCQQFGRALRVMVSAELQAIWGDLTDEQRRAHIAASPKYKALIIDHVGNVIRHGLPDAPREWSLASRERRSKSANDAIPLRYCLNVNADGMGTPCASVYPRYLKLCPYCQFYPEPPSRVAPEHVDGDLFELDPDTLAALRGEVDRIAGAPPMPSHLSPLAVAGLHKTWANRQAALGHLRNALALWSGWKRHQGHTDSEAYRIFYHSYGVDVMTAQTYSAKDAEALHARITGDLQKHGVIAA